MRMVVHICALPSTNELVMAFPDLGNKIKLVRERYSFGGEEIRRRITEKHPTVRAQNRTTYDRILADPLSRSLNEQDLYVALICEIVSERSERQVGKAAFRVNDLLHFCRLVGIEPLEAAHILGKKLPLPDLMVSMLFEPNARAQRYVGHYLIYRRDREPQDPRLPYIQACASITQDEYGFLQYEDHWTDHDTVQEFTGTCFDVGSILNIIGTDQSPNRGSRQEMWWAGFHTTYDRDGNTESLNGYVSDLTNDRRLYADRIVLVRVSPEKHAQVLNDRTYNVSKATVTKEAGALLKYLDAWKNLKI
jgi:hypothetical protein